MYRILSDDGILTIVTDNLWYGKLLTRQVDEMNDGGSLLFTTMPYVAEGISNKKRKHADTNDKSTLSSSWKVKFDSGKTNLYVGVPGPLAGHTVQASSYFDRLWKRGALEERFFLVLQKSPGHASPRVQQHIERLRNAEKARAEAMLSAATTTLSADSRLTKPAQVNKHKRLDLEEEEEISSEQKKEQQIQQEKPLGSEKSQSMDVDESSECEDDEERSSSSSDSEPTARAKAKAAVKAFSSQQKPNASNVQSSSSTQSSSRFEHIKRASTFPKQNRIPDNPNSARSHNGTPGDRRPSNFRPSSSDSNNPSKPKWSLKKRDENGKKRRKRDLLKASETTVASVDIPVSSAAEEAPLKKAKHNE